MFPPHVGRAGHDGVDWDTGLMLGELSVSSVITGLVSRSFFIVSSTLVRATASTNFGSLLVRAPG